MIRINLASKTAPKTKRPSAPLETKAQALVFLVALAAATGYLALDYVRLSTALHRAQDEIGKLQADLARLTQIQKEVASLEQQKAAIDQRVAVIQQLQQNRIGAQDLLEVMATTVNRTQSLWLTSLTRQENSFTIEGQAGSMVAVASLIAELRRSAYFQTVEIKEARQNTGAADATIFQFTLTAERSRSAAHSAPERPAGKG